MYSTGSSIQYTVINHNGKQYFLKRMSKKNITQETVVKITKTQDAGRL